MVRVLVSETQISLHYNHLLIIFFPRSGSAYEMLRESGATSQRTLRDYTYFVESSFGFSAQIDQMIMDAAQITTCPDDRSS